jgi:prepilin peptidase CpaA
MKIVISILIIATIFDIKTKKIPNFFSFLICLLAIYFSVTIKNMTLLKVMFELSLAFVMAYPLYYFNVLGAGDVKLLIAISSFLTLNSWLMLILISLLVASIVFIIRLVYIKELNFKQRHYYRYTHFFLWAYLILLIVF